MIGGAGGIGGLAFTFDDFDDQQSNSGTPRATIPHSDAGGNVTDLLRYSPAMGVNRERRADCVARYPAVRPKCPQTPRSTGLVVVGA